MTALLAIDEPDPPQRQRQQRPAFALWRLGFRPFYLLASVYAALSVGLWALQFAGVLHGPVLLDGALWHAHEMLFGFALAVVVGFLLTAGSNWTGRPTASGAPLAALALLWLAGRVLALTPYGWIAAIVDTAFPLAAAAALWAPFRATRNRRNYFFVGLLVALAGASLAVHLSRLGVVAAPGWAGVRIGLDLLLFIMVVMAGRVIPMFTDNGVPGAGAQSVAAVDRLALGSVLALLAADLLRPGAAPLAALLALAAAAHLARWLLWRPWKTLRAPLVWVLHAAYLWIPLHLALRAAAALGLVAESAATHALTAGAVGGLVIGMMTRTARGHTGRPLRADGIDVCCYLLVLAAALVRVALPLAMPAATVGAVLGSAALWSAGFGLYALRYGPWLVRPRVDGRPG